ADRWPVRNRRGGARGETRSRRTPRAAPGAGTAIGGDHPRGSQGGPRRLLTFERVGEGGKLHALPVEEAHTLPGAPGTGVEQQSGGELDASRGVGPEELDPRRQPAGRTEGGGDFVDRGELPPDEDSDPRLPGRRPARYWRRFHPAPRRLHPRGVGCSAVVARRCQGGVPLTDTIRYLTLVGEGMLELDRPEDALRYLDQALAIAATNPDLSFPMLAHAGKATALVRLNRRAEALR